MRLANTAVGIRIQTQMLTTLGGCARLLSSVPLLPVCFAQGSRLTPADCATEAHINLSFVTALLGCETHPPICGAQGKPGIVCIHKEVWSMPLWVTTLTGQCHCLVHTHTEYSRATAALGQPEGVLCGTRTQSTMQCSTRTSATKPLPPQTPLQRTADSYSGGGGLPGDNLNGDNFGRGEFRHLQES